MTKLHMPKGTDEVNYRNRSTKVPPDGNIEVSSEEAGFLLKEGGATEIFPEAVDYDEPPEGYARVRHYSNPRAGFSYDGVAYEPNEDGIIHAPHAAVVHIESHGFIVC